MTRAWNFQDRGGILSIGPGMLSSRDLNALRWLKSEEADILTLYLEIEGSSFGAAYRAALQAGLARQASLRERGKDLEKIERFVQEFKAEAHRGLAVFASDAQRLWRAYPLPQPVKSALLLGARPYLTPLLSIVDQYQRYGVALIGPAQARFLEVFLGEIEECEDEDAPVFRRPSARGEESPPLSAWGRRAAHLAGLRNWDRLIVGAPREMEGAFLSHLPMKLKDNLILDPLLVAQTGKGQVLERVLENECQARKLRESVLIHRLIDSFNGRGPAVLGLERTLEALGRGRVRTIFVRDGFAKLGRICPDCYCLSLTDKKCERCARPTDPAFNLIAEMAQEALDQGCEVFRILYDTRLDSFGHIGAELNDGSRSCAPKSSPKLLSSA